MTSIFVVEGFGELLALQRVFREAKFCNEPDDVEVSDSPVVARLFERLIATLVDADVARDGEIAAYRWQQWLEIDESRDEWRASIRRAKADARWLTFSEDERVEYVRLLLNPFSLAPEKLQKFVSEVNLSLS